MLFVLFATLDAEIVFRLEKFCRSMQIWIGWTNYTLMCFADFGVAIAASAAGITWLRNGNFFFAFLMFFTARNALVAALWENKEAEKKHFDMVERGYFNGLKIHPIAILIRFAMLIFSAVLYFLVPNSVPALAR